MLINIFLVTLPQAKLLTEILEVDFQILFATGKNKEQIAEFVEAIANLKDLPVINAIVPSAFGAERYIRALEIFTSKSIKITVIEATDFSFGIAATYLDRILNDPTSSMTTVRNHIDRWGPVPPRRELRMMAAGYRMALEDITRARQYSEKFGFKVEVLSFESLFEPGLAGAAGERMPLRRLAVEQLQKIITEIAPAIRGHALREQSLSHKNRFPSWKKNDVATSGVAIVMMVRDEEDIIYRNLAWHAASGVKQYLIIDNGSTDLTRYEIDRFREQHASMGVQVLVLNDSEVAYRQSERTTAAARFAHTYFNCDWIMAVDADEFIVTPKYDIPSYCNEIQGKISKNSRFDVNHPFYFGAMTLRLKNYRCTADDNPSIENPLARLVYCDKHFTGVKTAARWAPDFIFGQGNHDVFCEWGVRVPAYDASVDGVYIAHFPIRSWEHFKRKIVNGGRAYEALSSNDPKAGFHWRQFYNLLMAEGEDRLKSVFSEDFVKQAWRLHNSPLPAVRLTPEGYVHEKQSLTNNLKNHSNAPPMLEVRGTAYPIEGALVRPEGVAHSLMVRLDASDPHVLGQVFGDLEYNIEFSNPVEVVVDLGANVGFATSYFSMKFPKALIISVEPDIENFKMLGINLREVANVTLVHGAIWSSDGFVELVTSGSDGRDLGAWGVQTKEPVSSAQSHKLTPAYTIKTLMEQNNIEKIDLLKVDIEGAEVELFSSTDLEWLQSVEVIFVETHDRFRAGSSEVTSRILNKTHFLSEKSGEKLVFRRREAVQVGLPVEH